MEKKKFTFPKSMSKPGALLKQFHAKWWGEDEQELLAVVRIRPDVGWFSYFFNFWWVAALFNILLSYIQGILSLCLQGIPVKFWDALRRDGWHTFLSSFVFGNNSTPLQTHDSLIIWLVLFYLGFGIFLCVAAKRAVYNLRGLLAFSRHGPASLQDFSINKFVRTSSAFWLSRPKLMIVSEPEKILEILEQKEAQALATTAKLLEHLEVVTGDDAPPFKLLFELTDRLTITIFAREGNQATTEVCGPFVAPLCFLLTRQHDTLTPLREIRQHVYARRDMQIFGTHRARCDEVLLSLAQKAGLQPVEDRTIPLSDSETGEVEESEATDEMFQEVQEHAEPDERSDETPDDFKLFKHTYENRVSCWQLRPPYEVVEFPILNALYTSVQRLIETDKQPSGNDNLLYPLDELRRDVLQIRHEYGKGYLAENQKGKVLWPWAEERYKRYRDMCLSVFQYATQREQEYAASASSDLEKNDALSRAAQLYGWSALVATGLHPNKPYAQEAFKKCIDFYRGLSDLSSAYHLWREYKVQMRKLDKTWELPSEIAKLWPALFEYRPRYSRSDDDE